MKEPVISQKTPIPVEVREGTTYYWCACGKSAKQPFCHGAHKGTSFTPVAFTAKKDETVNICACKHSKNAPFCDGTHKNL